MQYETRFFGSPFFLVFRFFSDSEIFLLADHLIYNVHGLCFLNPEKILTQEKFYVEKVRLKERPKGETLIRDMHMAVPYIGGQERA